MEIDITKEPITKKEIKVERKNISNDIEKAHKAINKILLILSAISFVVLGITLLIFGLEIAPKMALVFICAICISVFTTAIDYRTCEIVESVKNARNTVRPSKDDMIELSIPLAVLSPIIGNILDMTIFGMLLLAFISAGLSLIIWGHLYRVHLGELQSSYFSFKDCDVEDLQGIKSCMKSNKVKKYCRKVGEQKREIIQIELEAIKEFYDKKSAEKSDNKVKEEIYD